MTKNEIEALLLPYFSDDGKWHKKPEKLIQTLLKAFQKQDVESRSDELNTIDSSMLKAQGLLGGHAVMNCSEMRRIIKARKAELQATLSKDGEDE